MYPPHVPPHHPPNPGYPAQAPYAHPAGYGAPMTQAGQAHPARPIYPGSYHGPTLASYGRRALGYLVDLVISVVLGATCMAAVTVPTVMAAPQPGGDSPTWFMIVAIVLGYATGFGAMFLYRWLPHANSGKTLGKRVAGIRLVKETTGRPVGRGPAAGRELVYFAGAYATCVGVFVDLLWPLWDRENQTMHDKVVSGIVIRD